MCVRADSAGNIKMDKSKSAEKIDGNVATVMALDGAIKNKGETSDSAYDSRYLLIYIRFFARSTIFILVTC